MTNSDTRRFNHLQRSLRTVSIAIVALLLFGVPVQAQTNLYWDSNGATTGAGTTPTGTWGSSAFWSTSSAGTAATANTLTTLLDTLTFSAGTTATGSYTVTVNGTQNAQLLSIEEGAVTFSGGTINLGNGGGITLLSSAGNGSITSNLGINGAQSFNIGSGRTLALSGGTFTRGTGAVLNLPFAGTVTSTMSGLSANNGSTGIIGPWATIGTGTNTKYARFNGTSTITSLTGTAAATAANVTGTTGNINYDLAAGGGAMPATVSANTIRYTGGAGSTTLSSSSFTVNGLMNVGSGNWNLSNTITIGADKELIVLAQTNSITINGVIQNNGGGASAMTVAGSNVYLGAANTYTGPTTISGGAFLVVGIGNTGSISPSSTINNAGGLILSRQSASMSQGTDFGLISGTGRVDTGIGTGFAIVMNGSNTYTGVTHVGSGTLKAGVASIANVSGAFGNNSAVELEGLGGAVLDITGFNTQIGSLAGGSSGSSVTLGAATLTVGGDNTSPVPYAGVISGSGGALTKIGTGTQTLSGANTYTGTTTVLAGTLAEASTGSISNSSNLTVNGATAVFDLGINHNDTVGTVTLQGGGSITGSATSTLTANTGQTFEMQSGNASVMLAGTTIPLNKTTAGTVTLSKANSYTGATTVLAGTLAEGPIGFISDSSNLTVNGATAVFDLGANHSDTVGTVTLQGGGSITGTGTSALTANTGQTFEMQSGSVSAILAGTAIPLNKTTAGTVTLSGANTYTGVTTISGGTLVLDYTASNTGKLSNTAALTLGSGMLQLDRATSASGNHTETVLSTTLNGTASITRGTGSTAVLQMNAITRNTGASVNFGAASIATTDTTNTNGILGPWATVAGADFAMNSTNAADGPITAYTSYTNVTRLSSGTKTIANGPTTNVRIVEGTGSAANVTLGAATTTINTLNHSASGGTSPATVDTSAGTLAVNGILAASGTGALTIGAAAGSGTLTAATAGGELILHNYSASDVTVNSTIANNTSASSFTQNGTGTTVLQAANTYTGGTTINGGNLRASNTTGSATGTSAVTVNAHGTLSGTGSVSGAVTVNTGGTLAPGANIGSLNVGALTLNSGSTFTYEINSSAALNVAADLLNVTGNLTIAASGAALSLSDAGSTYLTKLTLISYSGTWNGNTFDGLANGALLSLGANQYKLTYNDSNAGFNFDSETPSGISYVTLSAVPEAPAVLLGTLLCSVTGLGYWARKLGWRQTPA